MEMFLIVLVWIIAIIVALVFFVMALFGFFPWNVFYQDGPEWSWVEKLGPLRGAVLTHIVGIVGLAAVVSFGLSMGLFASDNADRCRGESVYQENSTTTYISNGKGALTPVTTTDWWCE